VTIQFKGASRVPLYLGLSPKANIIRSASADRFKGTNYGHFWGKRLLLQYIRRVGESEARPNAKMQYDFKSPFNTSAGSVRRF